MTAQITLKHFFQMTFKQHKYFISELIPSSKHEYDTLDAICW
jgi:hypothetical protein